MNKQVEYDDARNTVKIFIDLVQRHEQAFYSFVHKVHSKGQNLFDSLMRWVELFLSAIRDGLREKLSLEYLLPHKGKKRKEILQEIDSLALYHYKLKLAYEDKLRRRFQRSRGGNKEDEEIEEEVNQQLVGGVVSELNFGDLIEDDATEFAAEESDCSEGSYTSESGDDASSESAFSVEFSSKPVIDKSESISETFTTNAANFKTTQKRQSYADASNQGSSSSPNLFSRELPTDKSTSEDQSVTPPSIKSSLQSSCSKPLPPVPVSSSYSDNRKIDRRVNHNTSKRRQEATLRKPDLHHIPELLPLFIEVVCGSRLSGVVIVTIRVDETASGPCWVDAVNLHRG